MSNATNGKTYTEVVAEFDSKLTNVRIEFIERVNQSDTAIMEKLGLIHTDLGRGDEKFKSMDKRIDKNDKRIDGHDNDIKAVNRNQKYLGIGEIVLGVLASWGITIK